MCVQGTDLCLLDVNRAYCDMLGYARHELLGRDPLSLAAPEDREAMMAARGGAGTLEHLLRQGRVHVAERRFLRRDGRLLMLRVRTWIVEDPTLGNCAFTVSVDLTQGRQQVGQLIRDRDLFRLLRRTILSTAGERREVITLLDETDEIRMQQWLRAYLQRFERFFEQRRRSA